MTKVPVALGLIFGLVPVIALADGMDERRRPRARTVIEARAMVAGPPVVVAPVVLNPNCWEPWWRFQVLLKCQPLPKVAPAAVPMRTMRTSVRHQKPYPELFSWRYH